ncbi:hypothetical protein JQ604_09345 [Bradyrhizobium jicamae]|uniref:hypothetical protein n=1 Tax=Bradyrhizobium jicamae TaxID=280332 RepID=UPI001BAC3FAF|nr:hypothetical protein [Bradyrhizobium jicamae]MBR0752388.1 hypothetical protein [Bradyrhizobium jicamae]
MIRLLSVPLILLLLTGVAVAGTDVSGLAFIPSLVVVGLITGFAVLAAGWAIHRGVGGSRGP